MNSLGRAGPLQLWHRPSRFATPGAWSAVVQNWRVVGPRMIEVRVTRQAESAAKVAAVLGSHPAVEKLYYVGDPSHPQYELGRRQMSGAGNMIAFEVKGGKRGAFDVLRALQVIKISNNLGDAKSILTHPATTTHQRLSPEDRAAVGITDATLRLSVGLEHVDDLLEDVETALKAV